MKEDARKPGLIIECYTSADAARFAKQTGHEVDKSSASDGETNELRNDKDCDLRQLK